MASAESHHEDSTSATLLQRLKQPNNEIAWNQFVRLYTPLMFFWARKAGLSDTDSADLVQDVFCVLVRKLPGFEYDPTKQFRAWLRTVLINTWRNSCRRKVPIREALPGEIQDEAATSEFFQLEETEYRRHLLARASDLLQTEFEPATWRAFWEFAVLDKPAHEVAESLNLTVNAIYLAKSRVLRRLRRELAGFMD